MMTVKILHCADIHLDTPFADRDPEKASVRRSELRGAFSSMLTWARMNEVKLALIAGDLFDREYVTPDTVAQALREFAANRSCHFIISPGNHDPFTPGGVYDKAVFPPNVHIFKSGELSRFSFDDLGADVYGYAFTSPTLEYNPFAGHTPADKDKINILCAHGDVGTPASRYCPITAEEIAESGFDYIALGHIHNGAGVKLAGSVYYAYSGCLEGRDFGECGYKGAICGTLTKSDGAFSADLHGLRFSKKRYEAIEVNLTGAATADEAYDKISAAAKGYGSDTSLRLTMRGEISPSVNISESIIRSILSPSLFSLQIKNNTLPLFDQSLLENDKTIRGEFYRQLLPALTGPERQTAALALRLGLSALNGEVSFD